MTAASPSPPVALPLPLAAILIGGRSRRMGCDKAGIRGPDGSTLLQRTARTAAALATEVAVVGGPAHPRVGQFTWLPDPITGAGPLAGLCAALEYAAPRHVLLLACDLPLLGGDVLLALWQAVTPADDAVAYSRPGTSGGVEPCCAVYHPRILAAVRSALSGRRRGLHALIQTLDHVRILEPGPTEQRALTNANFPVDLAAIGFPVPGNDSQNRGRRLAQKPGVPA